MKGVQLIRQRIYWKRKICDSCLYRVLTPLRKTDKSESCTSALKPRIWLVCVDTAMYV